MVHVAHAIVACHHWEVAWLCSTAVASTVIVEAGEAGHLLKCGGGGSGVHGGMKLC